MEKFNNHFILPDLWGLSNHTPLSVYIIIEEKFIQEKKLTIVKNSKKKEEEFINNLRNRISYMEMSNIHNHKRLKEVT